MATRSYLSIGTKVRVSPHAQYLADEVAYIVDVAPETSHPYCVHRSSSSTNVADSHWMRRHEVWALPSLVRPVRPSQATQRKRSLAVGSRIRVDEQVPFGPHTGYVCEMTAAAVRVSARKHDPGGNIWIRREHVSLV